VDDEEKKGIRPYGLTAPHRILYPDYRPLLNLDRLCREPAKRMPLPCPEGYIYVRLCDDCETGWGYREWDGRASAHTDDLIAIPLSQHEHWEAVSEAYSAIQDEMEAVSLASRPVTCIPVYQVQP
jgi:hypothetical protein